jgi:hypothetical protein
VEDPPTTYEEDGNVGEANTSADEADICRVRCVNVVAEVSSTWSS